MITKLKKIELTIDMENTLIDTFVALDYLQENNNIIYNRVMELVPEEVFYMLRCRAVEEKLVEAYIEYNKKKSKKANDFRNPYQVKFNHLMGYIWECIMQSILENKGFHVARYGCDINILDARYEITNEPDFIIHDANNNAFLVDIQKGRYLTYKTVRAKEGKLLGLLKYGNVIVTWVDANLEGIYYNSLLFTNKDDIVKQSSEYTEKGIGGKPTYTYDVNKNDLRIV